MTTTADYQALMAAILANPDDDAPRLAMADHLSESGHEARAEFIRVQIEIAALGKELADLRSWDGAKEITHQRRVLAMTNRALELERREGFLLNTIRAELSQELPESIGVRWGIFISRHDDASWDTGTVGYNRGYPQSIGTWFVEWANRSREWLAKMPINQVQLSDLPRWDFFDSDMQLVWLPDDPDSVVIDIDDLRARTPPEPAFANDHDIVVEFLRHRWPGIDFIVPENYGHDEDSPIEPVESEEVREWDIEQHGRCPECEHEIENCECPPPGEYEDEE